MGNRVQRVRTEVSESQMAQAIIEAWNDLFHETPSKQQVSMVLAQNALETGSRKSMWNYNIGNITTDGKGSYDYFDDLKTNEQVSPGVWKKMNLKYRAYPSLKAGVIDYLRLLSSKKYGSAWQHIKNPDPVSFSKALKQQGYYTANEEPYTKTLTSLFGKFNKSNAYEVAQSGKAAPPGGAAMPSNTNMENLLNNFLRQVAASERDNKKLYKQYLPNNKLTISVKADYTDAIEFSRILCTALDEELTANSFTHSDGANVEVQCTIPGPAQECFSAVQQLTDAVAKAFQQATVKIGGVEVKTQFLMNKESSYQQISLDTATQQYRKFLLKFI